MNKLTLDEGEVECDRCEGTGSTKHHNLRTISDNLMTMCPKCFGIGKLDWIEVVVGKKGLSSSTTASTGSSVSSS